jgi:hypothetical protein
VEDRCEVLAGILAVLLVFSDLSIVGIRLKTVIQYP